MKRVTLGRTDLSVSALCLGSMTWGAQNTEAEGHAQIDVALDHGLDFIDTAEMYPASPGPDDHPGKTEEVIGSWIAKTGRRDDIVLATKITGEGSARTRGDETATAPIGPDTLPSAIDRSLKRLNTDYIDLYQLHWPNRGSYHFRRYWSFDPTGRDPKTVRQDIADTLGALSRAVEAGKIRHIGVSNETAWGVALFLEIAEREGLPRIATIQNEYSLLCRIFDTDLAEICTAEDVSLLPYSPLAAGVLSGKYQNGAIPPGSRRTFNPELGGRVNPNIWPATQTYLDIAAKHGLDPCQMALAWQLDLPFMGAPIFGATSIEQLRTAIGAVDLSLSDDVKADIAAAYKAHPMPL